MIVQPAAVEPRREHPRTERRDALTGLGDLHGVHVLAIDDEEDALTLLRVVLEAAGAQVTTLSSPLKALERIAEVKPHVLVLDLGMPEMDGFELIARIRKSTNAAVRHLPAAALTAFPDRRIAPRRCAVALRCISQTVDPGELWHLSRRWPNGSRRRTERQAWRYPTRTRARENGPSGRTATQAD